MFLVEQTTVPSASIPVAVLKDHLLLGTGFSDDAAQDTILEHYLRAAIAAIEARTGKVLLSKQYLWTLTAWRDRICQSLPVAPVASIDDVRVFDRMSNSTIVDPAEYLLVRDDHRPALKATTSNLPQIPNLGSLEITFTAGYGDTWDEVPPSLQQAVLLLAAHYHNDRRATGNAAEIPFGITALIQRFRNIRILGGGSK